LSDKPTLQELLEIQQHFGLPSPALVEKDWHVVKALAAIAAAETAPFQLVFGGGTALSRAHGLIRRMSEDIDFAHCRSREADARRAAQVAPHGHRGAARLRLCVRPGEP
jgi:predicted nucleotidyltransferase component of viral defense system